LIFGATKWLKVNDWGGTAIMAAPKSAISVNILVMELSEQVPITEKEAIANKPVAELLEQLNKNGFSLDRRTQETLKGNSRYIPRYGNEFAVGGGFILRRAVAPREGSLFGLMGKDFESARNEVWDFIEEQGEASPAEIDQVADMEMEEIKKEPGVFFDQIRKLKEKTDFNWEGTKMLYRFIKDAFYPPKKDRQTTSLPYKKRETGLKWADCKDMEFYFATSLRESKQRQENGASALVFYDQEGPLIFQRTGRYKMSHSDKYSESTAINLRPISVNGVRLPPGTIIGVSTKHSEKDMKKIIESKEDHILPANQITGVFPIRPSIYNISPDQQKETFGSHYDDFKSVFLAWNPSMPLPDITDFQQTAKEILRRQKDATA